MREPTALQRRWINEYLIDLNATAACRRAGYKGNANTLRKQGHTNLKLPHITQHLTRISQDKLDKASIEADEVLAQLNAIAFSNVADYLEVKDGLMTLKDPALRTPEQNAALADFQYTVTRYGRRIKVKMADKVKALDILARYLKLY